MSGPVHPLGRFRDPEDEARFLAPRFAGLLTRTQLSSAVVSVLCAATVVADQVRHPELVLALLPARIWVAAAFLLFVGPLKPRDYRGYWLRAGLTLASYSAGLAYQHYLREDPARLVLIWVLLMVFGSTALGWLPARWLALQHAWTLLAMSIAGVALGQQGELFGMELLSISTVAAASVWFGVAQEHAERTQQAETWRANALAESREAVLAAVAHELRTPLAVARMAVAVAQQKPERSVPLLERIDRRLVGLSGLVDAVLSLGSLDEVGEREPVDLGAIAREVLGDLAALDPDLRVEVVGQSETTGDRAFWRTAILNVAQNGARHAESTVRVTLGPGCVTVDDDGPGVPEPQRSRILEPMVRLQPASDGGPGYGMGLALAQRVLRAHGGRIEVHDSPLGGARFRMLFPESATTRSQTPH